MNLIPMYKVITLDANGEVEVSGSFQCEQSALTFYNRNVEQGYPTIMMYPDGTEIRNNC